MSHSSDTMAEKKDSGYRSIHVRLPDWLLDRITAHAEAVGQTPSVEIRRALVEAFTKGELCHCQIPMTEAYLTQKETTK